jgi:hypothetical protein
MKVFDSIELIFEFPYRCAVSVHLLATVAPFFVELVDYKCGVVIHHEAFDAELNGYMKTVQCRLILHSIVGCPEVDPKDVAKLVPRWRDEVYTYPDAIEV